MKIGLINGPNLDRLGLREPEIYGHTTLLELETSLQKLASEKNITLTCFQSNHEGAIVDKINSWAQSHSALIINPAAYTHSSIAIRDSIAGSGLLSVEVHISNIYTREEFRRKSITAEVCSAVISGMETKGYIYALEYLSSKRHEMFRPA